MPDLRDPAYTDAGSKRPGLPDADLRDPAYKGLQETRHHRPTLPVTDAINFAGSKPTPCLKTVSTLRTSAIVFDGSPATTTRSACLPAAIDPTLASRPR